MLSSISFLFIFPFSVSVNFATKNTSFGFSYLLGVFSIYNIDKSYILNELCRYEVFNLNYMNMLSNRSQVIYNKLWNAHIGKTRDKIINFLLLRCMTPYGAKKLSIRMEDLARLIDDTRINVSNVLNDLQNRGLIQLGRRTFSIPELREVVQLLDKKD